MPLWHRLVVVGAVLLVTAVVARLLDARIARRPLDPVQRTRYPVLRRSVATAVAVAGLPPALLGIPPRRPGAGRPPAPSAGRGPPRGLRVRRPLRERRPGL